MTVAELQQELLNMDPNLEVTVRDEFTGKYEPIHSWDYTYDPEGRHENPIGIVLWPRD